MNPLRRPRWWARLGGAALVLIGVWVLAVPITVAYVSTNLTTAPRVITTMYSWSTSEQDIMFSDATGTDLAHLDAAYSVDDRLTNGVRLNCGNTFSHGAGEQVEAPEGPQACSSARGPRRVTGWGMSGVGVAAIVGSFLPLGGAARRHNTYRQPYTQRRLLKRGR